MEKVSFTRNVNLQSEDGFIMGEHSKMPFEKKLFWLFSFLAWHGKITQIQLPKIQKKSSQNYKEKEK